MFIIICGYVLISYLFLFFIHVYIIYLVTLTLYEKIDKDMVMLSIITCSDAHCSISLASLPNGKNINNDTWITVTDQYDYTRLSKKIFHQGR
jgi:hypothetical protein